MDGPKFLPQAKIRQLRYFLTEPREKGESMRKALFALVLASVTRLAVAQEYPLVSPNLNRLKPPREDMSPAVFAGHAEFMSIARSVRAVELLGASGGQEKVVLKFGESGSKDFYPRQSTARVFEADITNSPIAAYPEARLLLQIKEIRPNPGRRQNPVVTAVLYVVGKYPFSSWGYGDVETPEISSEAQWVQTGLKFLGQNNNTDQCDPRFPCSPKIDYSYWASFTNSATGETLEDVFVLDRRL
jgi:hypothetical protein